MPRTIVLLAIAALAWLLIQGPALARDEEPTLRQLQTELTRTQAHVDRLEVRIATLEAAGAALMLEDRPSTDKTTEVFTLHRAYMETKLYKHTSDQARESLRGLSPEEQGRRLDQLFASVQKELARFDIRVELRANRSALIVEKSKGGTNISRGIWSRLKGKIIFTLTHVNGVAKKSSELVEAKDLGDALELPGGYLPFPIRVRKTP